jgi:hypothetical protein
MFKFLSTAFKKLFNPPLRPKVVPGTWYFETGGAHKVRFSVVVKLNEADCDEINNSKKVCKAWLRVLGRVTENKIWPILDTHFIFDMRPQWFQIHPMNKDILLRKGGRGKDIRELVRLNDELIERLA